MIARFAHLSEIDFARVRKDDSAFDLLDDEGAGDVAVLSLEKDWDGVRYLLNGRGDISAAGDGVAVAGGTDFGEDGGYGPARFFTPAEVADIAKRLAREGLEAEMRARYDEHAMESLGLYPGMTWDEEERCDELLDTFAALKAFYAEAAARGHVVVTAIL